MVSPGANNARPQVSLPACLNTAATVASPMSSPEAQAYVNMKRLAGETSLDTELDCGITVRAHAAPTAQQPYLELVPLPADAARESWLLNQLFHLLQERSLGHHLTLFVCLEKQTGSMSYALSP